MKKRFDKNFVFMHYTPVFSRGTRNTNFGEFFFDL